jgi:hypothetical protein
MLPTPKYRRSRNRVTPRLVKNPLLVFAKIAAKVKRSVKESSAKNKIMAPAEDGSTK